MTPAPNPIPPPSILDSERVLSIVAHDLQGSARILGSYAQLLHERLQGQLDSTCERYTEHLVHGAQRLQQQLHALLQLARIHEDRSPASMVDLGQIVRAAKNDLGLTTNSAHGNIECGPLPVVRGKAQQLLLLFQQLIDNALRYHGERPPHVEIDAEPHEDRWIIAVRDNGHGFDELYAHRIFELFTKLPGANNGDRCGAGLALAQRVALNHDGQLWATGQPGRGATLYLSLPAPKSSA